MNRTLQVLIIFLSFVACNKDDLDVPVQENGDLTFISAVDISRFPEIANLSPTFYDLEGNQNDLLTILKDNGVNTVRLKLWVDPSDEYAGFNEVKQFSKTLKVNGFKT